jgi:hypothetical protein
MLGQQLFFVAEVLNIIVPPQQAARASAFDSQQASAGQQDSVAAASSAQQGDATAQHEPSDTAADGQLPLSGQSPCSP